MCHIQPYLTFGVEFRIRNSSSYCLTLITSASDPSLWKNSSVVPQGMVYTQAPPPPGEHLARPPTVCVSTRLGVDDAVIDLQHRSLEHLENTGSTVRVVFVWTATWLHEPSDLRHNTDSCQQPLSKTQHFTTLTKQREQAPVLQSRVCDYQCDFRFNSGFSVLWRSKPVKSPTTVQRHHSTF